MQMKFVDVSGVMTRCVFAGDDTAPPLILVHGVSLTADVWMKNVDELGKDFHVVAVDMLGHGFTRPRSAEEPTRITSKMAHLLNLADALGFDEFFVCGSSYGGLIAANLYLSQKERVSKLVINGSGSSFNNKQQLQEIGTRLYNDYLPVVNEGTPDDWRHVLSSTVCRPESIPNELVVLLCLCYAQPWARKCWEETIDTIRDGEVCERFGILHRLEEFVVDTLVVWGREDRGAKYENAVDAVKKMPNARLVAFDDCSHLPMIECPARYNEVVRDFLVADR